MTEMLTIKLRTLATEALAATGDLAGQIAWLKDRADDVRDAVAAEAWHMACCRAVYDARHNAQQCLKRQAEGSTDPSNIKAVAAMAARSFLREWFVAGYGCLADTPGAALPELADAAEQEGKGKLAVAAFYRSLAAKVKGKALVGKRVKDADAIALWEAAAEEFLK